MTDITEEEVEQLKALEKVAGLCMEFYHAANAVNDVSASFDAHVSDQERSQIMELFDDINLLASGVTDPGPYIIMDFSKKAETADQVSDLYKKQVEFTELYTDIVLRGVSSETLANILSEHDGVDEAKAQFTELKVPKLASLC